MHALGSAVLALLCAAPSEIPQINPSQRAVLTKTLHQWSFDKDAEGWVAEKDCTLSAADGSLDITATGEDPYFHRRLDVEGGEMTLELRARCQTAGEGQIFWMTAQSPRRGEDKARRFALNHDGDWHDYRVEFSAPGLLTDLRLDPGQGEGTVQIDWMRLIRREAHPLTVDRVEVGDQSVRFTVRNHRTQPLPFSAAGKQYEPDGGQTVEIDVPIPKRRPLEAITLELKSENLSPVRRTVFLHHADLDTPWIELPLKGYSLQVAADGTLARIRRDDRLVGFIGPIVHCGGKIPVLRPTEQGPVVRFEGEGLTVAVSAARDEIAVAITAEQPCDGPVVRALGELEQGVFAGLEYLGKGEASSSTLDVETPEHLRYAPDPLKVTLPLMAFVTDRVSLAMTWTDMELQPLFATPNFFDATPDHRMALRGNKIEATVRVASDPLEGAIHWAVNERGLPPLPAPPRTVQQQWTLCLKALNGPLKTEQGWGHCVEDRWPRQPYADIASTVWRLTGNVPALPNLVPGGSHVRNESIYFVTGRALAWKEMQQARVRSILKRQQPDGSFRYNGKYRRGHFEDTASGVCARPAVDLLEYARLTGDREALDAAVKTLDYMKRFRTPRGAQVWEVPLHTPDQLASAYLVWAYVRGYELTGNDEYLEHARRWALSGIPFTYLWGKYPIMVYATPPVFGATNWRAPCWIGLPVQWVGGVYAYALTLLAPHDDSLDWNHLARGILIAAEQMQYPDGDYAGLLPDSLELRNQERRPWRINPSALVSLRLALDGKLDALAVGADDKHRVAAPFPVTIHGDKAIIQATPGRPYQILVDGVVVDIDSQGQDEIPLR